MGVSRALIVPLLFMRPAGENALHLHDGVHGPGAAGVGNVGGQLRVYLAFALPLGADACR